jgi:hypothetical protein
MEAREELSPEAIGSAIANNAGQAPSGSLFRCGPPREPEGQPGIAANGGCPQLMSALLPRRALRSDGTFRRIVASTYEGIAKAKQISPSMAAP